MKTSERMLTMRCVNCNRLHYIERHLLGRARQPHCYECGGPLDETKASKKRKKFKQQSVIAGRTKKHRCLGCGCDIGDEKDKTLLLIHLKNSQGCRREYDELGHVTEYGVIIPSLFVWSEYDARKGRKKWGVKGVTMSGGELNFSNFLSEKDAENFINKQKGE